MAMRYDTKNGCDVGNWLKNSFINEGAVHQHVKWLLDNFNVSSRNEIAWLLKAVACIDLTTLAGDDTISNVGRLCQKAVRPISMDIIKALAQTEREREWLEGLTTAAVCVYPARIGDATRTLRALGYHSLPVAAVATGFPSGQYPLETRLAEIRHCTDAGAQEVDVVLDRSLVLSARWFELHRQLALMKEAAQPAHVKAILSVGELGSFDNVYKASIVAMFAGVDFIKTSTGKEAVNATLPTGLVMCRAIRDYYRKTGRKVGLKPAGGLKSWRDALEWLALVHHELGPGWLTPDLFRIGASGLLTNLETRLHALAFGSPSPSYFYS